MDNKFRWNMFITSFLPLWVSIVVADLWNSVTVSINVWTRDIDVVSNLIEVLYANIVSFIVVLVVTAMTLTSIISTNKFIKYQRANVNQSKALVVKATRANKLSSEFLLAYILPMIAFDFTKLQSVSLFVIYFGVLAFLCIRNNNVYTNICFYNIILTFQY